MAIALRLSRGGAKKRPYYRIVAADQRSPRDGKYLEQVGMYNPLLAKDDEGRIKLNEDRIKYWLGVGAQPSDRVARFLDAAGIRERAARNNPNKAKPGEKATERAEEKVEKAAAAEEAKKAAEEEAKEAKKAADEEAKAAAEAPKEEAAPDADSTENDATGSVKTEETAEAVADAVADEVSADTPAEDAAAIAEEMNEGGPVVEEKTEDKADDKAEG